MTAIIPKYSDATGYLDDLSNEINESWFKMICDLACLSGISSLDQQALYTLFALYNEKASYLKINHVIVSTPTMTTLAADFLGEISGFTNFKLLGNTLRIEFKKRIALIFGTNGSGKSSLCESLKILANPEQPTRPIQNVRGTAASHPAFCYKFKSNPTLQTWSEKSGYGAMHSNIKYFDAGIAIKSLKTALEPGRIIILTPFKLHIFEWIKAMTMQFRAEIQSKKQRISSSLTIALENIRKEFASFTDYPLATINETTLNILNQQIETGKEFTQKGLLLEKQTTAIDLEKASSDEGLKLLKAEHRDLVAFLSSLEIIINATTSLWELEPVTKNKNLIKKQSEQEILAKTLIPTGETLENFLTLLRAAASLCNLQSPADHTCPLCKQDLGAKEIELFKKYHELLDGNLEKEITSIKLDLKNAEKFASEVSKVNRSEWTQSLMLPAQLINETNTDADLVISSALVNVEPIDKDKKALQSLKDLFATWTLQANTKKAAIDIAINDRQQLIIKLAKTLAEIKHLKYAQNISEKMQSLKETTKLMDETKALELLLSQFTPLQKKITDKAKLAYEELVVSDFETCLDNEYINLTEKSMKAFGVSLAKKGVDAVVTMLPQIGGKEIDSVLSEGEQRIHALALFFAELETCTQSVLIFDDPVSSFDYNYIANFSSRLRDFMLGHPKHQIIILTHNWEFFVQIQAAINGSGLNNELSVQVLENCTVVADYSERIDEFKKQIDAILILPNEPTKSQKEELAGKMRRLIEAVVNSHLFNDQRHQYKQKNNTVSDFTKYTKLVALLPLEAINLRDLYSKLSISEHDDPRNSYVNTDKAMFQTRYDNIIAIETAIIGRK